MVGVHRNDPPGNRAEMFPSQAATKPRSCSRRPTSQIASRSSRSPMPTPADWQLPPGVSRGVWDYLHDSTLARRYDESLAGTPLLDLDLRLVERHCPRPCRVIDLGCGTGRVAVPLTRKGHRVTAVDLSEEMLRVAAEKAAAAGVRLDCVRSNIVELDGVADAKFDVALSLF